MSWLSSSRTARASASALAVALLAFAGVACTGDEAGSPAGPAPSATTGGGATDVQRTASIYAAVIRTLVTEDNTMGSADGEFRVVFVLDGAVPGAENPERQGEPDEPFSSALKQELRAELADLPPLRFVADRSLVVRGESTASPGTVVNGGVLITLGPVSGRAQRVTVGNSLWRNGLAGQWLTYVVAFRGGAWTVVGTTGPTAIS